MAISGLGVGYALAGFTLLYSGYANQPIKAVLTGFLSGHPPAVNPSGAPTIGVQDNESSSGTGGTSGTSTPTGSAIADKALTYVGHPYLYGGSPGTSGSNPWDCSSFVNWVLGHDLGMAIPGQTGYSGTSHGPNTVSYLAWSGAKTIGNNPASAVAGDLCVWQTHMGIATGGGSMVSALDEALGTKVTTISGGAPGGELLFIRRIKAAEPEAVNTGTVAGSVAASGAFEPGA